MIGVITDSSELIRQGENKEVHNMRTALKELKNEGRLEGRQEGRQEGRLEGTHESVLKLLRKGFSASEVASLLDFTKEEILKIQQKA